MTLEIASRAVRQSASKRSLPKNQGLTLVVDLDERGGFCAHVEDAKGKSIYQFDNYDDETGWPNGSVWLIEDGFMRHGRDAEGLLTYLQSMGLAGPSATMTVQG